MEIQGGKMQKTAGRNEKRIRSNTITISRNKVMSRERTVVFKNVAGVPASAAQSRLKADEKQRNVKVSAEVLRLNKSLQLAMKEKLWLERQLAFITQNLQQSSEVDVSKYVQLTETNKALVQQVEFLSSSLNGSQNVEQELKERRTECADLHRRLIEKSKACDHLVAELETTVEKNLELKVFCSEVQQQLQRLQQQMKDVVDQRTQLEREHNKIQAQLQRRRDESNRSPYSAMSRRSEAGGVDNTQSTESVEILQSKLRELEKKCELQNVLHEELVLEMDTLRRMQAKKENQSFTLQEAEILSNGQEQPSKCAHSDLNCFCPSMPGVRDSTVAPGGTSGISYSSDNVNSIISSSSTAAVTTSNKIEMNAWSQAPKAVTVSDMVTEIDKIKAKIEQDDKILAELDRPRVSVGMTMPPSMAETTPCSFGAAETGFLRISKGYHHGPTSIAAAAAATTSAAATSAAATVTPSLAVMSGNSGTLAAVPTTFLHNSAPVTTTSRSVGTQNNPGNPDHSYVPPSIKSSLPTIVTTEHDVVHPARTLVNMLENRQRVNEDPGSYLDIPGIGRVQVHIARYSYDPFQHSPNENPEAELAVSAGDYVMVRGGMDEDGFFDGQLLDGRRGLVPSNFVEKLTGEDLIDFHQNVLYGIQESDDGMTSLPIEFSLGGLDDNQVLIESCLPGDVLCLSHLDNIDDRDEYPIMDPNNDGPEIFFSSLVPPPLNLALERQLHKSILISWIAPTAPAGTLDSFNVYIDGELRVTVLASERPRALVERVDTMVPHRISVRSVTPNRRMSVDAACTMIIGQGVPVAPSCVRASSITSTSAIISWLPSNSNYQHVVCVNSVEVRMLKPGIYRHTITGLSPNTTYRVTVKVKNIKSPFSDKKSVGRIETSSTSVDFRTLPKGLPDPPLDVQVETGPQDGTLLVTWLPVTITSTGTSNGSQVTGYAIYTDGKKAVDIDSPTGDHALLEIAKLQTTAPKHVTVRTKSGDSISPDSVQVPIPNLKQFHAKSKKKVAEEDYQDEESSDKSELSDIAEEAEDDVSDVIAEKGRGGAGAKDAKKGGDAKAAAAKKTDYGSGKGRTKELENKAAAAGKATSGRTHGERRSGQRRHDNMGQTVIEPDENLSDKEVYPSSNIPIPAIEITKDSANGRRNRDDYSDEEYRPHRHDPRGSVVSIRDGGPGVGRDKRQMGRDAAGGPYGRRPSNREGAPQLREHHGGPGHQQQRNVRSFVALFDYDPKTMSPNPGAAMEELPFREGQLIKIYGDKDPDGFYWGEAAGRQGYVPCNMVSQVQGEDVQPQGRRAVPPPRRTEQVHRGYAGRKHPGRDRWGDGHEGMAVKKMVALYDYDPQELSPNVDAEKVELSFNTGDFIHVYGDMDEDGFFMGEMNGVRGLVPSNFLTEAPTDYSDDPRRHSMDVHPAGKDRYDAHGMDHRQASHPDSNKYNHTRSGGQRW